MRKGVVNPLDSHRHDRVVRGDGHSIPQVSLERLILSSLELIIGRVRFDSFPSYRINTMYPLVMGTTQLLLEPVNLLGQRINTIRPPRGHD